MRNSGFKGIRAALFDLDGTLFDSVGLWHEIDDIFLGKRGKISTAEYKRAIAAISFTAAADFTIEYYSLDDTPEQLMSEWIELARHAYSHTVKLFDGAREYLEECRARGIHIVAVTSLKRELAEACMKNNGVFELFSHTVTSDEAGLLKSSPEIYLHAASLVGAKPSECAVFDDVSEAIEAAHAAGMHTVAIVRNDALYGSHDCAEIKIPDIRHAPELN